MSYSRSNRSNVRNKYTVENEPKKYCAVCEKAGHSERVFTSHFTKSVPGPKGIVICPTILNNECSFCFNRGHLKSACPAIAAKEKYEKKLAYKVRRLQKAKDVTKKSAASTAYQNRFGEYESSDSEEEEMQVATKGHSGPIGPSPVDVKPMDTSIPTFAQVLAREPPKPSLKEELFQTMFTVLRTDSSTATTKVNAATTAATIASTNQRRSWCELSDDEEEDENW